MRAALKGIAALIGLAVLAVAVLFAINATDEPLSEEAQRLLEFRNPPAPSDRNGFLDLRTLKDAPPRDWLRSECRKDYFSCIESPDGNANLEALIERYRQFLEGYRAIRQKPEFIDDTAADSPDLLDEQPEYRRLVDGSQLALAAAALRFRSGDWTGMLDELAAELAFQRKSAIGSRTLLQKMAAFARLDAAAVFASQLARRLPAKEQAALSRLEVLVEVPSAAELDVSRVLDLERANVVEWMRTRKHVRLPDAWYEEFKKTSGRERPWWDFAAPWLYRPNYSVNLYVAETNIAYSGAKLPSTEFLAWVDDYQTKYEARVRKVVKDWRSWILSPVRLFQFHLAGNDLDYVGRAHGHAGLQELVRLQVRLRAAGIAKPEEVAAALSGPLGAAHRDPFSGKPFAFDQKTMTISFPCEAKYLSVTGRGLRGADGMVTLSL